MIMLVHLYMRLWPNTTVADTTSRNLSQREWSTVSVDGSPTLFWFPAAERRGKKSKRSHSTLDISDSLTRLDLVSCWCLWPVWATWSQFLFLCGRSESPSLGPGDRQHNINKTNWWNPANSIPSALWCHKERWYLTERQPRSCSVSKSDFFF